MGEDTRLLPVVTVCCLSLFWAFGIGHGGLGCFYSSFYYPLFQCFLHTVLRDTPERTGNGSEVYEDGDLSSAVAWEARGEEIDVGESSSTSGRGHV